MPSVDGHSEQHDVLFCSDVVQQRISAVSHGSFFLVTDGVIGAAGRIMTHSETAVDDNYNSLVCIDVRDCRASRPEDGWLKVADTRVGMAL